MRITEQGRWEEHAYLLKNLNHHLNISLTLPPSKHNNLQSSNTFSACLQSSEIRNSHLDVMTHIADSQSRPQDGSVQGEPGKGNVVQETVMWEVMGILTWSISNKVPPVFTLASMAPLTLCCTSATVKAKAMSPLPAEEQPSVTY